MEKVNEADQQEDIPQNAPNLMRRQSTFRQVREQRQNEQEEVSPEVTEALRKARSRQKLNDIRDIIFYLILVGVFLGVPLKNIDDGLNKCKTPVVVWTLVQAGYYFSIVIKKVITLILSRNPDKPKSKDLLDLAYCCLFINFEFAWLIYGNTFHYSSDGLACKNGSEGGKAIWVIMMIAIAWGYFLFALYAILCCCGACLICCMACFGSLASNPVVDKIPYMNAVKNLRKNAFKDLKEKGMTNCIICMEDYQDEDVVAEAKCGGGHYFHTQCLEEWMKTKLECPLCKRAINAE